MFSMCYKGLARIIVKLHHIYGKLYLKSKTGLNKHTTILLLLSLLSWYVNTYEHITNEVIVTYDNNQDILTKYLNIMKYFLVKKG